MTSAIEGPTLAGPMPLADALPIARQIAEALEAAHEKGIIHRVTADGKVKVLDFGLAKAFDNDTRNPSSDPANSPTLTISATRAGMILGTAGYMSPEQARGLAVDKRADIWAYGVVLYEMLTGREMFSGETVSDALAAVLKSDVDWSALPPETPASIRRLLRRCIERDRKKRLRDIDGAAPRLRAPQAGGLPPSRCPQWPPWRSPPYISAKRHRQSPRLFGLRSLFRRRPASIGASPFRLTGAASPSPQAGRRERVCSGSASILRRWETQESRCFRRTTANGVRHARCHGRLEP